MGGGLQPDPVTEWQEGLQPPGHGGRGQLAVALHLDGGAGGVPAQPRLEQVEGAGAAGGGGAVFGGGQAGGVLGGGQDDVLGVPPQPNWAAPRTTTMKTQTTATNSMVAIPCWSPGWVWVLSCGVVQALGEAFEGVGDGVEEPVDGGQGDDQDGSGHEDVLGHGDAVLAAVEGGELGAAGQPQQPAAQPRNRAGDRGDGRHLL